MSIRNVNVAVPQPVQIQVPGIHESHGGDGQLSVPQGIQEVIQGGGAGALDGFGGSHPCLALPGFCHIGSGLTCPVRGLGQGGSTATGGLFRDGCATATAAGLARGFSPERSVLIDEERT